MDPSSAAARPLSRGIRHDPSRASVTIRTRGRPDRIVHRVGPGEIEPKATHVLCRVDNTVGFAPRAYAQT